MLRKLFKLFMYLIGVLVILIIGVAVFFDLDEELNAQKDAYLPEVEKLLGRKVQVGTIKTLSYILLQRRWNGLATAHNMFETRFGSNTGIGQEGL